MTQTIKQKRTGLPPELAEIKSPTTIHECLNIIFDLQEPQNYVDKYKLYLANQYFQDNILFLNLDQLERGFKNTYVKEKYDQLKTLNQCIKQNIAFPILFTSITNKTVSRDTLYSYCEVLSRHGKKEELNIIYDLYQFDNNPLEKLFKNSKNPSDTLIEVMIQNDVQYILEAKTWSEEKVVNWINDNKDKSVGIISKAAPSVLNCLPLAVQHAFYNHALEYFNLPENINNSDMNKVERDFLINMPITYIEYLKNNHSEYFNQKLQKRIRVPENGNAYTMNICQYVLCNRKFKSMGEIEVFSQYKDLIKSNISEQIELFMHEILAFEYALKIKNRPIFVPFDINSQLEPKEREILLSVSFNCLISHTNAKEKNLSNSWSYDLYDYNLTNCSDKEFNKYAKILSSLDKPLLDKELDNYRLIRKVNAIPLVNGQPENKLKI